jgi:hypothetical protein
MVAAHTCIFCGEAVTDDEPLVVIEHDGERETSLASEPELGQRRSALLVHAYCAEAARARSIAS